MKFLVVTFHTFYFNERSLHYKKNKNIYKKLKKNFKLTDSDIKYFSSNLIKNNFMGQQTLVNLLFHQ